jgi:thymidylate kinase
MANVALIGADGAGKTSVGRRLEADETVKIKYLYMGVNPESGSYLLPTTRCILRIKRWLGKPTSMGLPRDSERTKPRPKGLIRRAAARLKSSLLFANRLLEEWYRQCVSWYYQRRGYLVVFDRHYYADYYVHDIAGKPAHRSLGRRLHGFVLKRLYPKPDLVILLDAPAAVLFARKREGTVELLERRRQEYLELGALSQRFVVVDASQPLEEVMHRVTAIIREFCPSKKGARCAARV